MSEEKIGMYSTEEIYDELANGFLHRSMVDAMHFKIKDLQQKVEQQEKEIDRLNNIINELKWKPIEEYDKSNYDWVLVKYFDGDYECVPCVAEKRFGKWYSIDEKEIQFDVKYFMDMQQLDKLKALNNIIEELSKDVDMWNKKYNEQFNIINELEKWLEDNLGNCRTNQNYTSNQIYNLKEDIYYRCLDKLQELKEE